MNHLKFNQMLDCLNENIGKGQRIKVDELAKLLRVTRFNLNQICKSISGMGPYQIIANMEIEKAAYYYFVKKLEIKTIADLLGFSDASAFCHFFRKHTGTNLKSYMPKKYSNEM